MDKKTKASIAATLRSAAAQLTAGLEGWEPEEDRAWRSAVAHLSEAIGEISKAEEAGDTDYSGVKDVILEVMDNMAQLREGLPLAAKAKH